MWIAFNEQRFTAAQSHRRLPLGLGHVRRRLVRVLTDVSSLLDASLHSQSHMQASNSNHAE